MILGAALLLPAVGTAATHTATHTRSQLAKGSWEISPSISYSHENLKRDGVTAVDNFSQLDFTPTIGYCLSDHWEMTGGIITRYESTNGASATSWGGIAGMTYNFNTSGSMIPFASVGVGRVSNGGFNQAATIAPSMACGVRVLAGDTGSVNLSMGYQHETSTGMRQNRIVAAAGVSLFPWRNH
jgi:hypothetical protein